MAKKTFSTVDGLKREVNKRINSALREEIGDYVESKLKEHIQSDVYDTYDPVVYARRKDNGGLTDDTNIRRNVKSQVLSVFEEAPPDQSRLQDEPVTFNKPDALARIIEQGAKNPWNGKRYRWTEPRPFVSNTQKDINYRYAEIVKLLKKRINKE